MCIIGGGAIGAATAYYLKVMDPTVSVTVIERDPTYSIASTPRAAGGIRRIFSTPENIELSNYSIPFFDNFAEEMAVPGDVVDISLKKLGYLFIVPPEDMAELQRNQERQVSMGSHVEILSPEELQAKWPAMFVDDLGGGAFSPEDGWLDPHATLMALRKKAMYLGAEIISDEVIGMVRVGSKVTSAKLKSGSEIAAIHFVNAAGAWAKDICEMLDFKIPVEPLRRFEHYWEASEFVEPMPYLKDPERLAFRAEGKGWTGGVPTLAEPRGYNFEINGKYFDEVVWPAIAHRFPSFERVKCLRTLAGLYDQNDFDGNMIIGPGADGLENFHLLTGFSGHGLMHAPGSGRAQAELIITGCYQTIDLTRFGWQRIIENKPLRETGII